LRSNNLTLSDCLPEKAMAGDLNVTGLFALFLLEKTRCFLLIKRVHNLMSDKLLINW